MNTTRIRVRMKRVVWPADFRTNEVSMMNRVSRAERDALKANEAVCFVSSTGHMVRWVWKSANVGTIKTPVTGKTRPRVIWTSAQLRINRGEFSADMLSEYAKEAGIELVGLKLYSEKYGQE